MSIDVSADVWIYKEMMIKMSTGSGGYDITMELTDTNISDLTG